MTHEERAREWIDGAHAVHGGERTYESDIRSLAAAFAAVEREAIGRCAALFKFHGNPADGPVQMYEHEAYEQITALLPGDGGKA